MPCAGVRFTRRLLSDSLLEEADYLDSKGQPLKARWYRMKGTNLKGTPADRLIGHDGVGWMCGDGMLPCATCGFAADFLCDGPDGKGGTCDIAMCSACRTNVGPELDLCRLHVVLAAR